MAGIRFFQPSKCRGLSQVILIGGSLYGFPSNLIKLRGELIIRKPLLSGCVLWVQDVVQRLSYILR